MKIGDRLDLFHFPMVLRFPPAAQLGLVKTRVEQEVSAVPLICKEISLMETLILKIFVKSHPHCSFTHLGSDAACNPVLNRLGLSPNTGSEISNNDF